MVKKFIVNANHLLESMFDEDVEIAELEFMELHSSFQAWKREVMKKKQLEYLKQVVSELQQQGIHIQFTSRGGYHL